VRTTFLKTLLEAARQDPNIFLLTGDLGYSVLEPFRDELPRQYLNVGVAEQNMIGVAAGLAHEGYRPFCYSIANFPTLRCFEQIRNDVCYHGLPVTMVSVGGGLAYGPQGYTHHGVEDLGVMRLLPGMQVIAPADPVETKLATRYLASTASKKPAYLRLGKANEPICHASKPAWQPGKAITVQQGEKLAVLSTGGMLAEAISACESLPFRPTILSVPFLKPFDGLMVQELVRTHPMIVTLEEHSVLGGLGTCLAEVLAGTPHSCDVFSYSLPDAFCSEIGSQDYLKSVRLGGVAAFLKRVLRS
jgi:transketolase